MILSDSEVEDRLESNDNLINRLEHRHVIAIPKREVDQPGRIGNRIRELIGHVVNNGPETQKEVAEIFGVSKGTVNTSSRGLTNSNRLDPELAAKVRERADKQDTAHDEALDLMVNCIKGIKDKIANVEKPEKLSRIASDMGRIIGSFKEAEEARLPRMNVILYKPEIRNEKEYEIIEA